MRQPVQQGAGQPLVIREHLGPIHKRQVRGHNQTGLFVALAEEAKQMFGAHPIQGDIAELVDNNQIATPNVLFQLQDRSLLPGLDVCVHQLRGSKEFHFVSASAGLSAKANRQVRFTNAMWAGQDEIRFGFDILTSGQIQDVFLVEFRHIGKLI